MESKKHTVSLLIENESDTTIIAPVVETVEADSVRSAVGTALHKAFQILNSQYDGPKVTIAGVELTSTQVRKLKSNNFGVFRLDFPIIREDIMSQLIDYNDAASRLEYIKDTDRNGVYAKAKSVTVEQVAAQVVTQLRMVKDVTKWAKEDAKASIETPELTARRLLNQEKAKLRRLEEAKVKAALKAPAPAPATAE